MTFSAAVPLQDGDDGHEEYPLLALQVEPEVLAIMLDDIRSELGQDAITFLRQTKCLGRVVAVLLECKVAGHTPNLVETIALAGVEKEVSSLLRDTHPMEFTIEDLDRIIAHAKPAMLDTTAGIIMGEIRPKRSRKVRKLPTR